MHLPPDVVIRAYVQGYFPMAEGGALYWLDPDPRAVFEWENIHFSQRLLRRIRQGIFHVTFNQACVEVIAGCAQREETWISKPIQDTYGQLHELGYVHSVEVWQGELLVGGLYGVALGGLFSGESMFHRVTDASKVALYYLVTHLQKQGFSLLDAQLLNDHTARLGATLISRAKYRQRLRQALEQNCHFG